MCYFAIGNSSVKVAVTRKRPLLGLLVVAALAAGLAGVFHRSEDAQQEAGPLGPPGNPSTLCLSVQPGSPRDADTDVLHPGRTCRAGVREAPTASTSFACHCCAPRSSSGTVAGFSCTNE